MSLNLEREIERLRAAMQVDSVFAKWLDEHEQRKKEAEVWARRAVRAFCGECALGFGWIWGDAEDESVLPDDVAVVLVPCPRCGEHRSPPALTEVYHDEHGRYIGHRTEEGFVRDIREPKIA